jgi:hypothetical protein
VNGSAGLRMMVSDEACVKTFYTPKESEIKEET